MGLLLCLCSFAATFALVVAMGAWVAIVWLGGGDPKFGGIKGNLSVTWIALPGIVAVAALFAFAGARGHQEWMKGRWALASAGGAAAGSLTACAFFSIGALL